MDDKLSVAVLAALLFAILTAWIDEPWPSYCLYAVVFALGAIWSFRRLFRPAEIRLSFLFCLLCLIPAWGIVQSILGVTVNRWQTMNAVMLWSANAVLFFLATQLFADVPRRNRFLRRLLWLGLVLAVIAVFQLYTADGKIFWHFSTPYTGFIMGPFLYHNHFAAFVALILPVALNISVRNRNRQISYGLIVATLAAAVFASASRSGAILVVLEIAAGMVMTFKRTAEPIHTGFARMVVLACMVVGSVTIAGTDVLWERFHFSDPVRPRLAASTLEMIQSSPWTGSGLGTWPSVYPMHAHFDDGRFANQAHSDWLQWAAEGGIPLAFVLLCFAAAVSIASVRSVWALGIPAVLIQCCFDYPLQKPAVAAVFFVVAGAVAAQSNRPDHQPGTLDRRFKPMSLTSSPLRNN